MKIVNFLVAFWVVNPVLWANPQSDMQKMDLTSQICFVQPEVNGRMNIEESRLSLNNDQHVTLMGGQAACLYVYPGDYSFRIEFLDSQGMFHRKSNSPEYKVTLGKGEQAVFEVYPTTKEGEYTGGWRARLTEQNTDEK